MATEVRIDKWLWAARIFKTRTIAAEACKKGRISIAGSHLKASRTVKPGDIIEVRKSPITWSFKIIQAIDHRVGAKLVSDVFENVTPPEQLEILELSKVSGFVDRAKGTGRPTKKDRRVLEDYTDVIPSKDDIRIDDDGFDFEFDFDFDSGNN